MGYRMCMNIHKKISPEAKLFICDVNQTVLDTFIKESKGQAEVAVLGTPKDVALKAVRPSSLCISLEWY